MINSSTLFLGYLVIYLVDIEPTLMLEHLKVHFIEKMKIFRGLQRAQVSIPGWNYAQQWVEGERKWLEMWIFSYPKGDTPIYRNHSDISRVLARNFTLERLKKEVLVLQWSELVFKCKPPCKLTAAFLAPKFTPIFSQGFRRLNRHGSCFFWGGDVWNDRGSSFLTIMRSGFASEITLRSILRHTNLTLIQARIWTFVHDAVDGRNPAPAGMDKPL